MDFFYFYFLNIDISVTIHAMDPGFSVRFPKVLLEGSMSQIFHLGPTFHFM